MLDGEPAERLVDRYKTAEDRVAVATAAKVTAAWDRLGSIDRGEIAGFVAAVAPFLFAAKRSTVTLAAAFYALLLEIRPPVVPVETVAVDFASDAAFTATWHALSEGRPYVEAVNAGRSAADAAVHRYVTSVGRQTGGKVAETAKHTGKWRRIPSAGACEFCVRVSGQLYYSIDSADFGHDRCKCTAVPAT